MTHFPHMVDPPRTLGKQGPTFLLLPSTLKRFSIWSSFGTAQRLFPGFTQESETILAHGGFSHYYIHGITALGHASSNCFAHGRVR
jgi:hypothetical protein